MQVDETKGAESKDEEVKEVKEVIKSDVFTGSRFDELAISDKLKQVLQMHDFTTLTTIQQKAIPRLLEERNVILKSETGSGKTLAYLVPLIEKMSAYSLSVEKIWRDQGVYAIIFSPTRELCVQIDLEL